MLYLVKIEIAEEGGKKTVWIKPFKCVFLFFVIVIFVCEKAETSPIYVIVLPQQNIFFRVLHSV